MRLISAALIMTACIAAPDFDIVHEEMQRSTRILNDVQAQTSDSRNNLFCGSCNCFGGAIKDF